MLSNYSLTYSLLFSFFYSYGSHPDLHSFPTRRSSDLPRRLTERQRRCTPQRVVRRFRVLGGCGLRDRVHRSEEHTSELQSQFHLVCRLLLEKKNFPYHLASSRRWPRQRHVSYTCWYRL